MTPTSDDDDDADLDALLDEAETALNDGEVERALELLDGPAHEADADPEVRSMFGLALHYGGEYDDAFEYLQEAVAHDPDDVECRGALRKAYAAVEWQRVENLKLARQMLGNVTAWTCIHGGEGSWTDTGDPYWGGLQMDMTFMRTYGRDMIKLHKGGLADTWTPREQIIVAQRAFVQGRGYNPWPTTGRACGLIA